MAADKTKFCFKTSIPTFGKLVKKEGDTAVLRTNVPMSDNRTPATLDVSRAQLLAT
jgi:hypothetical protein